MGLDSVYLPERTLTVVPDDAAPTAALIESIQKIIQFQFLHLFLL